VYILNLDDVTGTQHTMNACTAYKQNSKLILIAKIYMLHTILKKLLRLR